MIPIFAVLIITRLIEKLNISIVHHPIAYTIELSPPCMTCECDSIVEPFCRSCNTCIRLTSGSGAIMSRLPALGLNKALLLSFSGWRQLSAGRGEDEHGSLDAPATQLTGRFQSDIQSSTVYECREASNTSLSYGVINCAT